MATLLSKKQFVLSICYSVFAAVLLILSCTLIVAKQEFSGQQILYKIYDSWALIIAAAPLALAAAAVFAFIGKKIPFLIFNLIYFCINIICILSCCKHCEIMPGLFIFLAVVTLMLFVVILQLLSKTDTAFVKIDYTTKEMAFNVCYLVSAMIVYLFMKAFCIMEISFYPYDDYYASWNFFGTFDEAFVSVSIFEVAILSVLTLSSILFWYKKHKTAFSFSMVYALMFLVAFFTNMDYPHRTSAFPFVAIVACIPVVLAVIKFRSSIKSNKSKSLT
ncbi:MAG: hypothetical protein J6C38_00880 [Oscillospiraceae bacterium]|nr:hypothetical protein [Oscillospiraceae bacterium]